jgi:hypothetical protein
VGSLSKKKIFTVYFDIACMIEVPAKTVEEAIQIAQTKVDEAEKGEAHSFRATEQ